MLPSTLLVLPSVLLCAPLTALRAPLSAPSHRSPCSPQCSSLLISPLLHAPLTAPLRSLPPASCPSISPPTRGSSQGCSAWSPAPGQVRWSLDGVSVPVFLLDIPPPHEQPAPRTQDAGVRVWAGVYLVGSARPSLVDGGREGAGQAGGRRSPQSHRAHTPSPQASRASREVSLVPTSPRNLPGEASSQFLGPASKRMACSGPRPAPTAVLEAWCNRRWAGQGQLWGPAGLFPHGAVLCPSVTGMGVSLRCAHAPSPAALVQAEPRADSPPWALSLWPAQPGPVSSSSDPLGAPSSCGAAFHSLCAGALGPPGHSCGHRGASHALQAPASTSELGLRGGHEAVVSWRVPWSAEDLGGLRAGHACSSVLSLPSPVLPRGLRARSSARPGRKQGAWVRAPHALGREPAASGQPWINGF